LSPEKVRTEPTSVAKGSVSRIRRGVFNVVRWKAVRIETLRAAAHGAGFLDHVDQHDGERDDPSVNANAMRHSRNT